MKSRFFAFVAGLLLIATASVGHASPKRESFTFSVVDQRVATDDKALLESVRHAGGGKASFVVLQGIRPKRESCHDDVYLRRSRLMADVHVPLILSLSAGDWAECRTDAGQQSAMDRLGFLRGMWFEKMQAQHAKQIHMTQQSTSAIYRQYSENVRWESHGMLFATINLPSNNNHYLSAAGRNNEFEDRLIANRQWLRRVFNYAKYRKIKAIVLFVDGNPMAVPARSGAKGNRDGFQETRKQLSGLVAQYSGKVLLVHAQRSSKNIAWRKNFGVMGIGQGAYDFVVMSGNTIRFSVKPARVSRRAGIK